MNAKDELLLMIRESPIIKRYRTIEALIANDAGIQAKMTILRDLQKQIVHAREFHKKALLSELDHKYERFRTDIESYPLMSDYMALQSEINQLLKDISSIIQDGIDKEYVSKCHNYANIGKKSQNP